VAQCRSENVLVLTSEEKKLEMVTRCWMKAMLRYRMTLDSPIPRAASSYSQPQLSFNGICFMNLQLAMALLVTSG
jgi:hypothetical protein